MSVHPHSPAVLQNLEDIVSESVPVFLEKAISVIEDLPSIVPDTKLCIVYFRFHIVRIVLNGYVKHYSKAQNRVSQSTVVLCVGKVLPICGHF